MLPPLVCHQCSVPVVPFARDFYSFHKRSRLIILTKRKKTPFPTKQSKEGGEGEGGSGCGNLKSSIIPVSPKKFKEKRRASELLKLMKRLCTSVLIGFQQHTRSAAGFKIWGNF